MITTDHFLPLSRHRNFQFVGVESAVVNLYRVYDQSFRRPITLTSFVSVPSYTILYTGSH